MRRSAMQETPQQYTQRMLNHSQGKEPCACSRPLRESWLP